MADRKILTVKVIGDSASARTSFRTVGTSAKIAGKEVTRAGVAAQRTGEHFNKAGGHVAGFTKRVAGGILAAAGLTYGLRKAVEGIREMVNDAVDLEKTQQRVNKLFGSNSGQIERWALGAAKSLGLSTNQADSAASMFALFGRTAKLTGKSLVTFSEQNTKLAVDLASFKNVDPSVVFKAMNSALAGNYRGLKQFGIVIDATQVKQQALAMGLTKTTKGALSPQARVLATQAILLRKASFATNDFAEHTDSAANKHKILTARIADVKEKLGTSLLPVMKSVMDFVGSKIVPGLVKFVNGLTSSGNATDRLTRAGRFLRATLTDIAAVLKGTIGWTTQHKTATKNLAIAFGALYLAVKIYNIQQRIANALTAAGGLLQFVKGIKLVVVVTKIWTAAQWLLNAALIDNPIGIVITALAALGVAFYLAWTHSATFRKIVIGAWNGIRIAAKAVADFMVAYVWPVIKGIWHAIAALTIWLGVHVFKPTLFMIRLVVGAAVSFFKNVFWPTVSWVWNNIGSKVIWLYVRVFRPYFAFIKWVVGLLIAFLKNVFWPAVSWTANKIWGVISWLLNKVFKPYFGGMIGVLKGVINFFKKDLVNGISTGIWAAYNAIKKAINFIKGAFQGGVHFITSVWSSLIGALSGVVKKIIDKVYTGGIKKLWDKVADVSGGLMHHLPNISFSGGGPVNNGGAQPMGTFHGLAGGGQVRGPGGPREDRIPAMLSNGEFVVNAQSTRRHRDLIERINNGMLPALASGGSVGAIERLQRMVGPSLRVTSTTGGGHGVNSYHYRGMAVDFAGSQRAMDIAAANLYKFGRYMLELIHSPNAYVKNGHPHNYSQAIRAQHYNHVHVAMTLAGALAAIAAKKSGKFGPMQGAGGPGAGLAKLISSIFAGGAAKYYGSAYHAASGITGPFNILGKSVGKKLVDVAASVTNKQVAKAVSMAEAADSFGGTRGVPLQQMLGRMGGWIGAASQFSNIPPSWVRGLEYIMSHESGGNPRAINRSDINARMGIPSSGLMQLIPPNFRHYHAKGTSSNIFDPVANIAAAVNYIHARYGSVYNTPWYHGKTYYDQGGWVPPGGSFVQNNTGRSEWLGPNGGTGEIHLHLHFEGPVTGNERQFVRQVLPVFRDEYQKASKRKGSPYFE